MSQTLWVLSVIKDDTNTMKARVGAHDLVLEVGVDLSIRIDAQALLSISPNRNRCMGRPNH